MITTISLICLIILSIYFYRKTYYDYTQNTLNIFSLIGVVLFLVLLLVHIICIGVSSYNYNIWKAKRDAFEKTLQVARETGNQFEIATIVNQISAWNVALSANQYMNKNIFIGQYIDDRVENLTATN